MPKEAADSPDRTACGTTTGCRVSGVGDAAPALMEVMLRCVFARSSCHGTGLAPGGHVDVLLADVADLGDGAFQRLVAQRGGDPLDAFGGAGSSGFIQSGRSCGGSERAGAHRGALGPGDGRRGVRSSVLAGPLAADSLDVWQSARRRCLEREPPLAWAPRVGSSARSSPAQRRYDTPAVHEDT